MFSQRHKRGAVLRNTIAMFRALRFHYLYVAAIGDGAAIAVAKPDADTVEVTFYGKRHDDASLRCWRRAPTSPARSRSRARPSRSSRNRARSAPAIWTAPASGSAASRREARSDFRTGSATHVAAEPGLVGIVERFDVFDDLS